MASLSVSGNYVKPLFKIALPIIISNIIGQVQMLIDRLFLARLGDLYMSALSNISAPLSFKTSTTSTGSSSATTKV